MKDKKHGKEILGPFHMKASAIPVAQKPRWVPYLLQKNTQEMSRPGMSRGTFERFLMMSQSLDVPH